MNKTDYSKEILKAAFQGMDTVIYLAALRGTR